MKNISLQLLLLFVGLCTSVFSQSNQVDQLQEVLAYYKTTEAYHIEVTYNMLRGLEGSNITESYRGDVRKIGDINIFSIKGSEIIQSPTEKITINDQRQIMSYETKADNTIEGSPVNLSMFLEYYKIENVTTQNGLQVYELVLDKKDLEVAFSRIKLYIDQEDKHLVKQELLFSRYMPFKEGNSSKLDYARLVIDMEHRVQDPRQKVAISDYVVRKNGRIVSTEKYKNYKLLNKAQ